MNPVSHLAREALVSSHSFTTTEERVAACMEVIDNIGMRPVPLWDWIEM